MMPMRRPPRRPREMPRPSWAAKPLASMPWPSALGMTKIWPSVRTPSTSKIRTFMFLARDLAVIRLGALGGPVGPPGYRSFGTALLMRWLVFHGVGELEDETGYGQDYVDEVRFLVAFEVDAATGHSVGADGGCG